MSTLLLGVKAHSQTIIDKAHKTELGVPPKNLVFNNGKKLRQTNQWPRRREEILQIFQEHVYGKTPLNSHSSTYETIELNRPALNQKALRTQVKISLKHHQIEHELYMLIYIPTNPNKAKDIFTSLNFQGNHTISKDPAILLNKSWTHKRESVGILSHHAQESHRGTMQNRWPPDLIISRGSGLATMCYADLEPDKPKFYSQSVRQVIFRQDNEAWSAIGAWAWELSQMAYVLSTHVEFKHQPLFVCGHSRLRKVALWAEA